MEIKKQLLCLLTGALLAIAAVPLYAAPQVEKDTAAWWERNIGRLTHKDEPLAGRFESVVARVSAAADSNAARPPKVLLLKRGSGQWAAALPDGTVLISQEALVICYQGVAPEKGDSRLAFLIGHELAHQAKNDFWQADAIESMKGFVSKNPKALQVVSDYIRETSDLENSPQSEKVAKAKELQADAYGIVYMTMAGYDPHAVVDRDGTNFVEEFVSRVIGKKDVKDVEDAAHPSPAKRAEFLRTQLAAVANELELFRVGVRYYQQGRYKEAIPYFERFRQQFPSREVFNNLGLAHYQLALEQLAGCDPSLAYQYKLPALLDTETLAAATRGGERGSCLQNQDFLYEIGEAVKNLELARAKDPRYLPARINQASALLIAGNPSSAKAIANEALRLAPQNPDAQTVQAIALYRAAAEDGLDGSARALSTLIPLAKAAHPDAQYNLAVILAEKGRTAEAKQQFSAFLKLEKSGPYATIAAKQLGQTPPVAVAKAKRLGLVSPIPTGDKLSVADKALKPMSKREMIVANERVTIYSAKDAFALVLDDNGQEVVDLVESTKPATQSADTFRKKNGMPQKIIQTLSGQTLIYPNVSVDVAGGMVRSVVFFAPRSL